MHLVLVGGALLSKVTCVDGRLTTPIVANKASVPTQECHGREVSRRSQALQSCAAVQWAPSLQGHSRAIVRRRRGRCEDISSCRCACTIASAMLLLPWRRGCKPDDLCTSWVCCRMAAPEASLATLPRALYLCSRTRHDTRQERGERRGWRRWGRAANRPRKRQKSYVCSRERTRCEPTPNRIR